jgi:hypothetical protein
MLAVTSSAIRAEFIEFQTMAQNLKARILCHLAIEIAIHSPIYIGDTAALDASEVVMGPPIAVVSAESSGKAQVNNCPFLFKDIEIAIHCAETDVRHLFAHLLINPVGRGMGGCPFQNPQDSLFLLRASRHNCNSYYYSIASLSFCQGGSPQSLPYNPRVQIQLRLTGYGDEGLIVV